MEGRVGKAMTEAVAKALQARMFERKDGVWLFPQMVMDDAARVKMTARAKIDVRFVGGRRTGHGFSCSEIPNNCRRGPCLF